MKVTISDAVKYIGVDDKTIDLFESQYVVPEGVSYNSYLILDEKVALMDTVDVRGMQEWEKNLTEALGGRKVDYLVIQHLEPDHAGSIGRLLELYPDVTLVGNAKTFAMLPQFFDIDPDVKKLTVAEGDTLSLGSHTLTFVMAPMVHWPEVMVTYDETDKVLFSADAFGTFGALNGTIFDDEIDFDRDWLDDARRYYTNIVGKYGGPVQTTLKKAAGLDISIICPLHGPIWRSNLGYILDKYNTWSSYEPEEKAVMIAYASMYGNTENLANVLAAKLAEAGIHNIAVYDVSNTHVSTLISEAFRCSHIVLAAPTYNGNVYPVMENFLNDMKALAVQKRTVAILDNGTWAATAGKQMADKIAEMKDMKIIEPKVSIKSSLKNEQLEQLDELVAEIKKDF